MNLNPGHCGSQGMRGGVSKFDILKFAGSQSNLQIVQGKKYIRLYVFAVISCCSEILQNVHFKFLIFIGCGSGVAILVSCNHHITPCFAKCKFTKSSIPQHCVKELLIYTKILEVNLFAFAYRLFHRDFSPVNGTYVPTYVLLIGEKSL